MASWMVHLRIADQLLDALPGLSPVDFIVGNIAPDSGVPDETWTVFTPSTKISHFKSESSPHTKKVYYPDFITKYFTPKCKSSILWSSIPSFWGI